jgi:ubiquilin
MADSAEGAADPQVTFKVKTSGDKTHTITMAESALVSDLKTKLAGSDYEDIPVDRQRLIYSGRVMKNEEPLSTYKIKAGNTVHMVKSAASNPAPAPPASSSTPAAPQVPTNMAAGTANNPLAGLTGARYAGLTNLPSADMFGPDGGMTSGSGVNEQDFSAMLENPNFVQQMNEMLNNDAFIQMMESHPAFRGNPAALRAFRSPEFRRMMLNPDTLRSAARMQNMMRGSPGGGAGGFPMPGVTDNDASESNTTGANNDANPGTGAGAGAGTGGAGQFNPFDPQMLASLQQAYGGAGGAGAANPLAGMFNPFGALGGQAGQGAGAQGAGGAQAPDNAGAQGAGAPQGLGSSNPQPNPFASLFGGMPGAGQGAGQGGNLENPFGLPPLSPEALQQMLQTMGMGSPTGSPAPADNRPPEERYAEQLRQLNDMGFYDFDRNVAALRRSGGSVQGAIEHLLNS